MAAAEDWAAHGEAVQGSLMALCNARQLSAQRNGAAEEEGKHSCHAAKLQSMAAKRLPPSHENQVVCTTCTHLPPLDFSMSVGRQELSWKLHWLCCVHCGQARPQSC